MVFKADDYIAMIDDEINWCKNHDYTNLSPDYKEGFIKGLEQAKILIRQTKIVR